MENSVSADNYWSTAQKNCFLIYIYESPQPSLLAGTGLLHFRNSMMSDSVSDHELI